MKRASVARRGVSTVLETAFLLFTLPVIAVVFIFSWPTLFERHLSTQKTWTQIEVDAKLEAHKRWLKLNSCLADANGVIDPERQRLVTSQEPGVEQANFFMANLGGLDLGGRDLRCATFVGSILDGASFQASDLRGALFTRSDLSSASLINADLRGAIFNWSNLKGVIFEPRTMPLAHHIAYAENLGWLNTPAQPYYLVTLRKVLDDAGYSAKAKQVIAAINRVKLPQNSWRPSADWLDATVYVIRYLLFDLTCEYGANAVRPLALMGLSWVSFALIYWAFNYLSRGSSLYVVLKSYGVDEPRTRRLPQVRGMKGLRIAALFSARNVVRLGFGQFDLGVWVRMLQQHDYDVLGSRWLRTVAALQALLSQYLIALSVLSAFGTPFAA